MASRKHKKLAKEVGKYFWQAMFELAWHGTTIYFIVDIEASQEKMVIAVSTAPFSQERLAEAYEKGYASTKIEASV